MNKVVAIMTEPYEVAKRIMGTVFIFMMHCEDPHVVRVTFLTYLWSIATQKPLSVR